MNKPETITGDWIKQQISNFKANFKEETSVRNHSGFTLNKNAVKLQEKILELQKICPHQYINQHCIYCGSKEEHNG